MNKHLVSILLVLCLANLAFSASYRGILGRSSGSSKPTGRLGFDSQYGNVMQPFEARGTRREPIRFGKRRFGKYYDNSETADVFYMMPVQ